MDTNNIHNRMTILDLAIRHKEQQINDCQEELRRLRNLETKFSSMEEARDNQIQSSFLLKYVGETNKYFVNGEIYPIVSYNFSYWEFSKGVFVLEDHLINQHHINSDYLIRNFVFA